MAEAAAVAGRDRPGKERPLPVFSFPRSGRTWLTHIWLHYAMAVTGQELDIAEAPLSPQRPTDHPGYRDGVIPALLAAGLRPLRFKHAFAIEKAGAVDEKIGPRRRLALLVRDPVKVMESFAYRMRSADRLRKPPRYPEARDMSLSEIVRSDRHGVGRLIDYHRAFDAVRSDEHYVLYYEDMRADAAPVVEGLLRHAGHEEVDRAALGRAIESSTFERMQEQERQYRFQVGLPLEAHAFRFRAASEQTELSAEDAAYIQEQVRASDVGLLARYVAG